MQIVRLVGNEYIQTGPINKNCLGVLSLQSDKKYQKFAIGDDSGSVNTFEFTKGELSLKFKTPPMTKEITRLELSGSSLANKDRLFFAAGTAIRGVSKVGKEFFKFDTNLTEAIRGLSVEESTIWTSGDYLLNEFESEKDTMNDKNYYLCKEKINDLYVHCITSTSTFNPILACQQNSIKVVEKSKEFYKYATTSAANCISQYSKEKKMQNSKQSLDRTMVFGMNDGSLLSLALNPDTPVYIWSIKGQRDPTQIEVASNSGITIVLNYDFSENGMNDILLARDDASLEYYTPNINGELELQNKTVLNEAITGLGAGKISNPNLNEFLVSTYSGRVLGYLDSEESTKAENKKNKENPKEVERKIKMLQMDIDKLKQNIEELNALGDSSESNSLPTFANTFKTNYKIVPNTEEGIYSILIDSQYPIQILTIQSAVSIELIETDNNVAILSHTEEDRENSNLLLATYRILESNISKFEIKLRTIEGKSGNIFCYVIPIAIPKTCQVITIPIKPLSLHEKYNEDLDEESLPLNILKITGAFSKNDIHCWISNILPDIPLNNDDEVYTIYKSCFVGTILICDYKSGSAVFKSDSISTITIIKDCISHEASDRSMHINIKCDLNDDSVKRVIELLSEKFEYHSKLHKDFQMIPALRELQIQEGNVGFLSKEMQLILDNDKEIEKNHLNQPKKLQYLRGIISDLYVDRATCKGLININQKMQTLLQILNNFSVERVLDFFFKEK